MYFGTKNYLKSNRNHTAKHTLKMWIPPYNPSWEYVIAIVNLPIFYMQKLHKPSAVNMFWIRFFQCLFICFKSSFEKNNF